MISRVASLGPRATLAPVARALVGAGFHCSPVPCVDVMTSSPHGVYGDFQVPFVSSMDVIEPFAKGIIPAYRIMAEDGSIVEGASEPEVDADEAIKMYSYMVQLQIFDEIFFKSQRQGRISFFMQSAGEEGTHVGSASALSPDDLVFAQYRETGVLMWRGFTLDDLAGQCFSAYDDLGKGRQMPVHYGVARLNFQTISSPLSTQIPQAAGAAYAYKHAGEDRCVICYFGDGAASEGDFHAALNFASTLKAPVIFFCRNNGYAISTPTKDQYAGDGIAARGVAYGMHTIRVDGNDVFAVQEATKAARAIAMEEGRPTLIEAMTYREGHHSTSDNSELYREREEIEDWHENRNPVLRMKLFLTRKGWWDDEREAELRADVDSAVKSALAAGGRKGKPTLDEMFTDVYDVKSKLLIKQEADLKAHMAKYPDVYSSGAH